MNRIERIDNPTSINFIDLQQVASTIMNLLSIPPGKDVALILGSHISECNKIAIANWLHDYLQNNPSEHDFKAHIFPRFVTHYRQSQTELLERIRVWV